jgi:DNA-binding XRE family transcriptional regulator
MAELVNKSWSPADLAKVAEVPEGTIYSILSNRRNGNIKTMGKICKALGLSATELLIED